LTKEGSKRYEERWENLKMKNESLITRQVKKDGTEENNFSVNVLLKTIIIVKKLILIMISYIGLNNKTMYHTLNAP
jgi:hypothetical protein